MPNMMYHGFKLVVPIHVFCRRFERTSTPVLHLTPLCLATSFRMQVSEEAVFRQSLWIRGRSQLQFHCSWPFDAVFDEGRCWGGGEGVIDLYTAMFGLCLLLLFLRFCVSISFVFFRSFNSLSFPCFSRCCLLVFFSVFASVSLQFLYYV
jgi:hypothetical protein